MNRKELLEVKKTFSVKGMLGSLHGAYINSEGKVLAFTHSKTISMTDELLHKYSAIFKKDLSGKFGKNLHNLQFNTDIAEKNDMKECMLKIAGERSADSDFNTLVEMFFNELIKNISYPENYCILLMTNVYDYPMKTSDNVKSFEFSDGTYEFFNCVICPVKLQKADLAFDNKEMDFDEALRNWIVKPPMHGFLYPAFTDRMVDTETVLYYSKKEVDNNLLNALTCREIVEPEQEKSFFSYTFKNNKSVDSALSMLNELSDKINEDNIEGRVTKEEFIDIIRNSDISDSDRNDIEKEYDKRFTDKDLSVNALINTKNIKIKSANSTITIPLEYSDNLSVKIVDGKRCIVLPAEGEISINDTVITL